MRTGLLSAITNPHVYRKLQNEASSIDVPLTQVISNATALKLPYLQAFIKESMRHHPSACATLPRLVGPEGDTHNGIYLPPGTEVGQCAWNLHRHNTRAYGDDAHVFRPERWLEASGEKLTIMEETHNLVFGYGRFRCSEFPNPLPPGRFALLHFPMSSYPSLSQC